MQITVKGHVVDATGEPVIGASVIEGKSTNGTITDIDEMCIRDSYYITGTTSTPDRHFPGQRDCWDWNDGL